MKFCSVYLFIIVLLLLFSFTTLSVHLLIGKHSTFLSFFFLKLGKIIIKIRLSGKEMQAGLSHKLKKVRVMVAR